MCHVTVGLSFDNNFVSHLCARVIVHFACRMRECIQCNLLISRKCKIKNINLKLYNSRQMILRERDNFVFAGDIKRI